VLVQLQKDFPQDVRIVTRHFPLSNHPLSLLATQGAEAAGLQGKFWEMNEYLMAQQQNWSGMTADQFTSWLKDTAAKAAGLDVTKFNTDLTSDAMVQKALEAQAEGNRVKVTYTPFVVIDGKVWQGPNDLANLEAVVKLLKMEARLFTTCPPMTIDTTKQYIATLQTEKGDIVIQLYADKAPLTVNSFVFLAKNGWFDGIIFHRVIAGFVAQTGDPSGTGYGTPGYYIMDEIDPGLKFDKAGVLGMANAGTGTGTNGSQFFITYAAQSSLDGKYTIFGQVIQGMDVVEKLTGRDPSQATELPPGDKIIKVTIQEK
jgi:cyclophilin family peptidyl-prolyl cis-trans isomerase